MKTKYLLSFFIYSAWSCMVWFLHWHKGTKTAASPVVQKQISTHPKTHSTFTLPILFSYVSHIRLFFINVQVKRVNMECPTTYPATVVRPKEKHREEHTLLQVQTIYNALTIKNVTFYQSENLIYLQMSFMSLLVNQYSNWFNSFDIKSSF